MQYVFITFMSLVNEEVHDARYCGVGSWRSCNRIPGIRHMQWLRPREPSIQLILFCWCIWPPEPGGRWVCAQALCTEDIENFRRCLKQAVSIIRALTTAISNWDKNKLNATTRCRMQVLFVKTGLKKVLRLWAIKLEISDYEQQYSIFRQPPLE
jgi:hypothetical protein